MERGSDAGGDIVSGVKDAGRSTDRTRATGATVASDSRFEHDASRPQRWHGVVEDARETLTRVPLILDLAAMDILERYRGSVLGPFWLTLSTAVLIAALGVVYSRLFGMDIDAYVPWLATGLVCWTLISATIQEGCAAFSGQEGLIRSVRLPFGVHVARVLARNLVVFAHNLPIVVLVLLGFGAGVSPWALALFPLALGLALILLGAVALGLAVVCARFRDIPPVVAAALQILFFVTPIMWKPEMLGEAAVWLWLNPMHPLLALLREPLLGHPPPALAWLATLAWTGAAGGLSLWLFARYRDRLAFWV